MLRRLRAAIGVFLQLRRRDRAFRRWLRHHPGASYGAFYADGARRRLGQAGKAGVIIPRTLGGQVDSAAARRRAESVLGYLKWAGCRPGHAVVDFGCGSLWIGAVLMAYLDPGRYTGLDVTDHFYREALERLGADFVADRRPALDVISPAALARVGGGNPDFVISIAVLRHVRPGELAAYFSQLIALCGPATRLVIGHKPHDWTRVDGFQSLRHSRHSIRAALAGLGYEPRFDQAPDAPPCRVAMFEIVRSAPDPC